MSASCRLPDGRTISLATDITDRLGCAVVVLAGVRAYPDDDLQAEIEALSRDLRRDYADRPPSGIAGLGEARALYKGFGMDPSRHRPSSEALLRRVLQGKGLYRISPVVDACNLASLEFLLPIGLYDLQCVRGDVELRTGRPGEEYPGIRKGMVHLQGRPGLFDADGGFGSPTSDSARTCIDTGTTEVLAVIMATASFSSERLAAHAARFVGIFERHCAARGVFRAVLNGGGA